MSDGEVVTFPPGVSVPPFFIHPAEISSLTSEPLFRRLGTEELALPCHASGHPNPDIHWLKNGKPMDFQDPLGPQLEPNRWTLTIRHLKVLLIGRHYPRSMASRRGSDVPKAPGTEQMD